jgi:hypothetical protein
VRVTLGSRPRQGVGRWRVKRKTRESLRMRPGVQKVWGREPSHSQVNSHVESWSPKRTPKSSKCDCKRQNSLSWGVLYIIRKLLKRRCLKWARVAHLNICNTSYGQKNGRESNWQCRNPTLKKCEDDTHTLEMGTWESSGTLENLELDYMGQNTLPWSVFYTVRKVLKLDVENGLTWAIRTFAAQVMCERRAGS